MRVRPRIFIYQDKLPGMNGHLQSIMRTWNNAPTGGRTPRMALRPSMLSNRLERFYAVSLGENRQSLEAARFLPQLQCDKMGICSVNSTIMCEVTYKHGTDVATG